MLIAVPTRHRGSGSTFALKSHVIAVTVAASTPAATAA